MSKTTTTKTTAVANNAKTNESVETLLTVTELKKFFVECGVVPKYSDGSHYVGIGVRKNEFSVNALKTKYNCYCSDTVFEMVNGKVDGVEYIENGNSSDHTRNNTVVAKTTAQLTELIALVKNGLHGVSIA